MAAVFHFSVVIITVIGSVVAQLPEGQLSSSSFGENAQYNTPGFSSNLPDQFLFGQPGMPSGGEDPYFTSVPGEGEPRANPDRNTDPMHPGIMGTFGNLDSIQNARGPSTRLDGQLPAPGVLPGNSGTQLESSNFFEIAPPFGISTPPFVQNPNGMPTLPGSFSPFPNPEFQGFQGPFSFPGPPDARFYSNYPDMNIFDSQNQPITSPQNDNQPEVKNKQNAQQIPGVFASVSPQPSSDVQLSQGFYRIPRFMPGLTPTFSNSQTAGNFDQYRPGWFPSIYPSTNNNENGLPKTPSMQPDPIPRESEKNVDNKVRDPLSPEMKDLNGMPDISPEQLNADSKRGQLNNDLKNPSGPNFNPLFPTPFPFNEVNHLSPVFFPGAFHWRDLGNANYIQNQTLPAISGFNLGFPPLDIPPENHLTPPILNTGFWPPIPQGNLRSGYNKPNRTSPVVPGLFGLSPFDYFHENQLPINIFESGKRQVFPSGFQTTPAKNAKPQVRILPHPGTFGLMHAPHDPLLLFPPGVPIPFPGVNHPLLNDVHYLMLPGFHPSVLTPTGYPVTGGNGITPKKRDSQASNSKLDLTQPTTSVPPLSPFSSGSTNQEKTPSKNEQFSEILKELLDEVKAAKKEGKLKCSKNLLTLLENKNTKKKRRKTIRAIS